MSRQINLLGIVGEPGQDGSYDIQVRTTDGLPVGTFKIDENGQPVVKDYVEQAKSASKVYVTDAQGKDSAKPLSDFAMQSDIPVVPINYSNLAMFIVDCNSGFNDVTNVTVSGSVTDMVILGESGKKFGIFYAIVGSSIEIGYSGVGDDYSADAYPSNFEAEGSGESLSITGTATAGVFYIRLAK